MNRVNRDIGYNEESKDSRDGNDSRDSKESRTNRESRGRRDDIKKTVTPDRTQNTETARTRETTE